MENKRLKDKSILVTGAGSGIGRAMSLRFASEGASLVICDINSDTIEETKNMILNKNPDVSILTSVTDISNEDQIKELVSKTYQNFEHLNVLVNNAGIPGPEVALIKVSSKDWEKVINVNLKGTWMMCKYFGQKMKRQKHLKPLRGKIINVSSLAGKVGHPIIGPYSISKFGIIGLTQCLAIELAPHITVNALCPGMIKTNIYKMNEELMQVALNEYGFNIKLKRWGSADDVANVAFFLASDDSNYLTGQSLNVTGGMIFH
ncbi:MAG: SDR family NAD(P)-dependent oxidoreductase [Candidatus Helarchaeota archaeon]